MADKPNPVAKELWFDTTEGFFYNQDNKLIALLNNRLNIPTANEIVTRYNSQLDLLTALETTLAALERFGKEANWSASALSGECIAMVNEAPGIARAALKKARGEK